MPIDPQIPLSVRPPQIADPLEQAGRVLQTRNLIQQGQMGALDIQQKQTAIDNMKATNDNYLKALTVGPDGKATIDQGVDARARLWRPRRTDSRNSQKRQRRAGIGRQA